ncbi:LuxR family two component transcriptional regulator [Nitrosomonas ureae]|uniref:Two component transcriptional regulator, LuxR family n=1 Tax=Nitrosomonas ureae TaxID=44577 RepID=A0A286AG15_9PROT|nr:response regulator transcription factor [Nitrosomonas ureae]PXX10176.1 LuxR family two component transcriptional regulator [Nitrosomonas ureae]SOD20838.1 two component transcriptional regulator, LuxR family [Nitrosomonas ureae]
MVKVLIADDHALFRDGLKRIFSETDDIEVVAEAIDGKDTIKKAKEYDWDIALLDINLPDMNGLEVLKRISSANLPSYVLVLSMYPEEEYAIRAIRSGASGYMTKDSPTDQLINVVRRLANGGKYVNPELAEKLLFTPIINSEKLIHTTFSDREFHVFKLIVSGESLTSIANKLSLSVKTVSTYRSRILEKMRMKNNAQLIRYAIQHRLIE